MSAFQKAGRNRLHLIAAVIVLALLGPAAGAHGPAVAPEIAATTWLNSAPLRLADLKGRVILVEFWTFGCYNCRNVEPHVQEWQRTYSPRGLVVVGVHTPETAYERDVGNVERYVREHKISYPVAIDRDFVTWERYGNTAWPAWYLIDKRGIIRYTHVGEGAYAETEQQIQRLLAE
jgi:thiol-disulfide isomerase/thioredoxin